MIMQQHTNEEFCNLLVESLISRDEKLLQKVLAQEDEVIIKDILTRLPINYVRKLIIELANLISSNISIQALKWIQYLLATKYSVISTMTDGRSILMPIISILEDKSSPQYYNKLVTLKGKVSLLKQIRESRHIDVPVNVVKVDEEKEKVTQMEVESDTDTEDELNEADDEEEFEGELEDEDSQMEDDANEEDEFYDGKEDLGDEEGADDEEE